MKFGSIEIIDNNGWNLNEVIPEWDWKVEESNLKIPPEFGVGIKTRYNGEDFTFKHVFNETPVVKLIVTTWRGISTNAIHYYGSLQITFPEMEKDNQPGHIVNLYGVSEIPMFSNNKITLTRVLEQSEIDDDPIRHEYFDAGDNVSSFYTPASVIKRGKEMFENIFGKGWVLKIDELH
ncbi:MAG TPA: hypothetical protein PLD95_02105 [bacterium]|nr:hypothetical protein [bacterium]